MCQYFVTFYDWIIFCCMHHISFIHSVVGEYLSCFYFLTLYLILPWTFLDKFSFEHVFSSLGYIHRSRIGSHGISIFNFLRNCPVGQWPNHFTSSPAIYDGECSNFSIISPTFIFCFIWLFYLNYSHSAEYLIVVLISTFLITNDVEYILIFTYTLC